MSYLIQYDRNRFPRRLRRQDGQWGCRGCGEVIPKGRTSWCSNECVEKFEPHYVLRAVGRRDNGVCAICGFDSVKARAEWRKKRPGKYNGLGIFYDQWRKEKPVGVHYDHIIPFSDGGLTILENMRTLCETCHKRITAEWRSLKSGRKKVS